MLFTHQDLKEEKKKKGSIEIDLAEPELYVFFLSKTCRLDYPQCFVSGILVDFYSPICVYLWWELILKKNNSGGRWQLKISLRQPVCQKSCYFHGGGGGRSECTCSKYWGGGGGDISPCLGPDMETVSVIRLNAPCTPSKTAACGFRCVTLVTVSVAWSRDKEQAKVWSAPEFLTPNQPDVFIFIHTLTQVTSLGAIYQTSHSSPWRHYCTRGQWKCPWSQHQTFIKPRERKNI